MGRSLDASARPGAVAWWSRPIGLGRLALALAVCCVRRVDAQTTARSSDAAGPARPAAVLPAPTPAGEQGMIVTVTALAAIGWANAPVVRVAERPDARAVLLIPAGARPFGPRVRCWSSSRDRVPTIGDRYQLTVVPLPPPTTVGGPYQLHLRLTERGATSYWDVLACTRL